MLLLPPFDQGGNRGTERLHYYPRSHSQGGAEVWDLLMARNRGAAWAVRRVKGQAWVPAPISLTPLCFHLVNNGHQPGLRAPCWPLSGWQSSKESDGLQPPWGEDESATDSNYRQSQSRAGGETLRRGRLQLVVEGFLQRRLLLWALRTGWICPVWSEWGCH